MKHGVAPPSSNPANTRMAINMDGMGKHRQYRETPDQQHRDNQHVLRPKRSASGPKDAAPTVAPTSADEQSVEMGELDTEFLGDERRCDADRLGIDATSALTRAQQTIATI